MRGVVTTTLDYGECPGWLFERMVKLSSIILEIMVDLHGPEGTLKIITHPIWFQSFGTFLGFDWNASGLTTILTAAMKEAIKKNFRDIGIAIFGGKGKTALNTPQEIKEFLDKGGWEHAHRLIHISRITAKIDNSLIQDGFSIYHHTVFVSEKGEWAVVQQGMNTRYALARRYHWQNIPAEKFLKDPHIFVSPQDILPQVLNLAASTSENNRNSILDFLSHPPSATINEIETLSKTFNTIKISGENNLLFAVLSHRDFKTHPVVNENPFNNRYLKKMLEFLCGRKYSFMELILKEGVGQKTLRALSLAAEIIYGAPPSYTDPARYSFAHGGKDRVPYPIDIQTYDYTIDFIKRKLEIKGMIKKSHLHTPSLPKA